MTVRIFRDNQKVDRERVWSSKFKLWFEEGRLVNDLFSFRNVITQIRTKKQSQCLPFSILTTVLNITNAKEPTT